MIRAVGIDLGTTNTVAAIEGTVLQHSAGLHESPILPSVVAWPPSGATLVGVTARKRRAIDPKNTLYSTKRVMGQRWLSYGATSFRKSYPFDLVETEDGQCAFLTRGGRFTPPDVASKIIQKIFATHQSMRGDACAIVTVPAAFEEAARQATRAAAVRAGLSRVRIVEEPIATAIAYATLENARQRIAAVYDLGGGTFDLAVIDCQAKPIRVICHAGDPYLGGDDVDFAIAQWAAKEVLERFRWDLRSSPEVFDRLLVQCERAKIQAGATGTGQIELSQIDPASPRAAERLTLPRALLDELAQDLVSRTFLLCDQVLHSAGLDVSRIDSVYLAGGAATMPLVQDSVARYFGALPRSEFDPMHVVAIGASLAAETQ